MTKQEFLNGKEFVFKGANYRAKKKESISLEYIEPQMVRS